MKPDPTDGSCPLPLPHRERIVLGHGGGGSLTHDLIADVFYPSFANSVLLEGDDAAVLADGEGGELAFTTDAHIVSPLFFPGGDIGRLAVCGTVNDLAMVGARPLGLAAAFILEEGFATDDLRRITASMREAADEAGIQIVTGDTKVAERGKVDGLFITTTAVGRIPEGRRARATGLRAGDAVLVSGPLGDHGIAVLSARGDLQIQAEVVSDTAPLNRLVEAIYESGAEVHAMRDLTRGGLAAALNELAEQSRVSIHLQEGAIPVRPAVEAACEVLGFDALQVANEGKLVVFVPDEDADRVLSAMHSLAYGSQACRVGEVRETPKGRVLVRTEIGGQRVVDLPAGELLPRIC